MPPPIGRRRIEEFRRAFAGEIDSLAALYRNAAAEMLHVLDDASATLFARQRAVAHLRQYQAVLADLRDEAAAWIELNIPRAYDIGLEFADHGIRNIRRAGVNLGRRQRDVFSQVHREAAQAIVAEMLRATDFALAQIGRRANDAFRRVGIEEVAKGIAAGKARAEVSRQIRTRLIEQARPFFTDASGRMWDLDRYAEMVARTTTREAMTQGTINRLREHRIRLAQVSAHNAADFCIYYENAVVCIEGEHPVYPPISAIGGGPPFHPNCVHVLTPFVERLATDEERKAGIISPDLLNRSPAELQRRFRKQFPERARREGIRVIRAGRQQRRARAPATVPPPTQEAQAASPGALRRALSREERAIRGNAYETAVVVDRDGAVALRKRGGQSYVRFTEEEARLITGRIISHNHPAGRSFSPDDVKLACHYGAAEMRAVTQRHRHVMGPPEGGWSRELWDRSIGPAYNRHAVVVGRELRAARAAGGMTQAQADAEFHHEVWRRVASETGLGYSRTSWSAPRARSR